MTLPVQTCLVIYPPYSRQTEAGQVKQGCNCDSVWLVGLGSWVWYSRPERRGDVFRGRMKGMEGWGRGWPGSDAVPSMPIVLVCVRACNVQCSGGGRQGK